MAESDGPITNLGAMLQAGRKQGAEDMRERAAQLADEMLQGPVSDISRIPYAIRKLEVE